jgi:DNA-binding CsgD family transcriptional regulator
MVDRAYRSSHLPVPIARPPEPGTELDPVQLRVLFLMAAGTTAAEIASALDISSSPAETRIRDVRNGLADAY